MDGQMWIAYPGADGELRIKKADKGLLRETAAYYRVDSKGRARYYAIGYKHEFTEQELNEPAVYPDEEEQ